MIVTLKYIQNLMALSSFCDGETKLTSCGGPEPMVRSLSFRVSRANPYGNTGQSYHYSV